MLRILLILLLATSWVSSASAQSEWELREDSDGIKAYTRTVEGIKFHEFLVEMTLDASLSEVMAIFKDFDVYPDLFPGTKDIKVYLDKPEHHVTYIKFDLPFPARDRDAVFDNHIDYNQADDRLTIAVQCLPDTYETDPDLVRITYCKGGWEFTRIADNKVAIRHNLVVDPGGFAPAFIVNAKMLKDPITTLKMLRERISDQKYKGQKFAMLSPE